MQEIVEKYYASNAKAIRTMADRILLKFGGILDKDKDDFYSLANEVFTQSLKSFDESKCDFNGYFYSNLTKRIITEVRDRNRTKRSNTIKEIDDDGTVLYQFNKDISLDASINDEDMGITIGSIIESPKQIVETSENIDNYMDKLSKTQKKIASMIMDNYSLSEIREELNISGSKFKKIVDDMKSFEKKIILKKDERQTKEDNVMEINVTTFEKSKTNRLCISSLIKKIQSQTIRFNHPLQRASGQWTSVMKGNLISDILQNNPINPLVFAEEIINGVPIIWDLDGKQRSTNAYEYAKDSFKISKKIRRPIIKYTCVLDTLDSNGFPQSEIREFDISNKKFSQLPDELKERFLDYNFEIVQYINCSKEDIAYHIARYNEGKAMSVSHKGIIELGEKFASIVKNISAMPFFTEQGGYTVSEAKGTNGTINRVVVEGIMAAYYIGNWKKELEEMCRYLRDKANEAAFEDFEDLVDRLSLVITDNVARKFDSKDSFIYFGLFARFAEMGIKDNRFIDFMNELDQIISDNGNTYSDLCAIAGTKDKSVVIAKIEFLTKLMMEYLNVKKQPETTILDFLKENVSESITQDDVSLYEDMLDDLTLCVDNKSALMEKKNRPSLLAIVAYSCVEDIVIDNWFVNYFETNKKYKQNQTENYNCMRENLQKTIQNLVYAV